MIYEAYRITVIERDILMGEWPDWRGLTHVRV
jgi:hypothetical protein